MRKYVPAQDFVVARESGDFSDTHFVTWSTRDVGVQYTDWIQSTVQSSNVYNTVVPHILMGAAPKGAVSPKWINNKAEACF